MTTKYKVGDAVVCNGYQGSVSAVTDYGMIEVRFERGGVCVDPNDALTVQPGEVWDHMCSAAKSDMRKARKEGSILICKTRYGVIELTYKAGTYEARAQGLNERFCTSGRAKDMAERLASVYCVTVE